METALAIASRNPQFPHITTLGATLHIPRDGRENRSIVVIVHGHGGHRDYCYQKLLSGTLAIPSIRFDFSGCGVQLGEGTTKIETEVPRLISSDLIDLGTIIQYVRKQGYFVTALVGHSRGAVACLQYARTDHSIPTIVNCSGRYRAHLILEKVRQNQHLKQDMTGYWEKQRAGTGGDLVRKWTLLTEIDSVAEQEMAGIGAVLHPDTNVLVIFGTKDNIVPVADAGMFITELRERGDLYLVDDADHNFFIQPTDTRPVKTNKNQEVANIIAHYLSAEATRRRFLRRHEMIKVPRFKLIEGLQNYRDLGGFEAFPTKLVYRSADLSSLTASGAIQLSRDVRFIFDLRADPEVQKNGTVGPVQTAPLSLNHVQRIHVPIFKHIDYSPEGLAKFFGPATRTLQEREAGMVKAYKSILHNAKPVFTTLFHHLGQVIKDKQSNLDPRGVLLHCSAGKDRTGILCAVLLLFAGVSEETVALEYELTTFGLAADKSSMHHSALIHREDSSNKTSDQIGQGSHAETMRKTIRLLKEEFGGVDQYLSSCVDGDDYKIVKAFLTTGATQRSRL